MILGFGVWVHHMFATGLPGLGLSFFSGASHRRSSLPSAVAVFAWLATIWLGRPVITTAFLFFASMILLFVIGGVSGFMTASVPVDWQLTDTYFVVAHLHYVLIGINVFPVVGATYFWFPKMTGRLLDERLGRWNFWTMFIGFNLAFLPMHLTGLLGMPRRVYTYADGMGWDTLNLITSHRQLRVRGRRAAVLRQRAEEPEERRAGGRQSLGRADAGVVGALAAAALQLRGDSDRRLAPSAVGGPAAASRRPCPRIDRGMLLDQGKETIGTTPLDAVPGHDPGDARGHASRRSCSRSGSPSCSSGCCSKSGWPSPARSVLPRWHPGLAVAAARAARKGACPWLKSLLRL